MFVLSQSMALTEQEPVTGPWPHVKYQSLNRKQWEDTGDLGGHRFPCMTSRYVTTAFKLQHNTETRCPHIILEVYIDV